MSHVSLRAAAASCVLGVCAQGLPCGVATVITHGFSSDKGLWVEGMADAVLARAGSTPGNPIGTVFRYTEASGEWTFVSGTGLSHEPVVLIFNWTSAADPLGDSNGEQGTAEGAADVLFSLLADAETDLPGFDHPMAQGTVHFIGHSRGAVVNSEAAQRLGVAGIDTHIHLTALDAHPVNGTFDEPNIPFTDPYDWGDPVPKAWANVTWADAYWRADGDSFFNSFDFDGMPIEGAYNVQLSESALDNGGYSFAHSNTHLWYHGTIDLASNAFDGEVTLTDSMRNAYYTDGGAGVGYFYSDIAGGLPRPAEGSDSGIDPGGWDAPGGVASVFNGDFELGADQLAGWAYHGGSGDGADWASEGANQYLTLPASNGSLERVHNRLWIDHEWIVLKFDWRVPIAGGSDSFVVELVDDEGVATVLADVTPGVIPEWTPAQVALPGDVCGEGFELRLRLGGVAGDLQVHIDNLRFDDETTGRVKCAADLDDSGDVGVNDLLELLGAWGSGPCEADLNGDGIVDLVDLLELLGAWGACG